MRPDEVMEIIERLLEAGVSSRVEIVDEVCRTFEMDAAALRRLAADKAVSLALASMRDENGERLAFPSRDTEGNRIVVHIAYTKDAWAMHRAGVHLENVGKSMVRSGKRLQERAVQLGLWDGQESAA